MSKCDVCGKEAETVVACSSCGAVSFAYCTECLNGGREPYDALVGMGLIYDCINKSYREQILLPSLRFHGKTIAEFNADVEKMDAEYYDWLQRQDECVALESEMEQFGGF
jgi:hypothetical protein